MTSPVHAPPFIYRLLCDTLAHQAPMSIANGLDSRFLNPNLNWEQLIAFANHTLLTPNFWQAIKEKKLEASLPADLPEYLDFLLERHIERHTRLKEQAIEAIAILNEHDVVPVTLKGITDILSLGPVKSPLTGDIDLLVAEHEQRRAIRALENIGYENIGTLGTKELGNFMRPKDVGCLDLHAHCLKQRDILPNEQILPDAEIRQIGNLRYKTLSFTHYLSHLILHDQLQDGQHFKGRIKFKNLWRISRIMHGQQDDIDWEKLKTVAVSASMLTAVKSHLQAAKDLFHAPVPTNLSLIGWERAHHMRRLAQIRHSVFDALSWRIGLNFAKLTGKYQEF